MGSFVMDYIVQSGAYSGGGDVVSGPHWRTQRGKELGGSTPHWIFKILCIVCLQNISPSQLL